MKYAEGFNVFIDVETTAGPRYLFYTADDYTNLGTGEYVHHGLGIWARDGKWHTFVRDLQADLQKAQPGASILRVNGFLIAVVEEWIILYCVLSFFTLRQTVCKIASQE